MSSAFRSNVPAILREQGRSVTWFCRKVGIDTSMFYRMEHGERRMSAAYRRRAAEVLAVPESILFLPVDVPSRTIYDPIGTPA